MQSKGATVEEIKNLSEEDTETEKYIQGNNGYFIADKDLLSTWLSMGKGFDVSHVRDLRWYNEKRIKMSLGGMSPLAYRRSIGFVA